MTISTTERPYVDHVLDGITGRTRHHSWHVSGHDEYADDPTTLTIDMATSAIGPQIIAGRWAFSPTEARQLADVLIAAANCLEPQS